MLPTSYDLAPECELEGIKDPRVILLTYKLGDYHHVSQATLSDGSKVRARCVGWKPARKPEVVEQVRVTLFALSQLVTANNPPQTFWSDAVMLKYLKHPNIAPFFGFTLKPLQYVTEWTPNGDLSEYIKKHPDANRVQLVGVHFRS